MASHRLRSALRSAYLPALAALPFVLLGAQGCETVGVGLPPQTVLSPATATMEVGTRAWLRISGVSSGVTCQWSSSDPAIVASLGNGAFRGVATGHAVATATCGSAQPASAQIVVAALPDPPLVITQGGTYTGVWRSNDPNTPAIRVETTDPVIIQDSVVTGRGNLIEIGSKQNGANVTVHDVTGVALDPLRAGSQRGSFVSGQSIASLRVTHCSMLGVSFGVKVLSSQANQVTIAENLGVDLEDRASDGAGDLLPLRPQLGHFIFLNQDTIGQGADISWNQLSDTIGQSSTEDVINIYKSQGTQANPIHVHDNYLEGFSSTTTPSYTGTGIIADGDAYAPVTAYTLIEGNQIVHAAGSGIEIAAGHDVTVSNNRVVSCGLDAAGSWYNMPFVNAVVVWNYYNGPTLINDTVHGTQGGVVRPSSNATPQIADLWTREADLDSSDILGPNAFDDPCIINGQVDTSAEDTERAAWASKRSQAHVVVGDRHMN